MKTRLACAIVAATWASSSLAAASLETFAAPEEIKDAVISPDGRYLAVITTRDESRMALVGDLHGEGKLAPVLAPNEKDDFDIAWCRFADNTRLLCGLRGTASVRQYIVPSSTVAAVDADGKNATQLTSSQYGTPTVADERIFDRMPEEPGKVLMRTGTGDAMDSVRPTYLYRVDLAGGKNTFLKEPLSDRRLWNVYTDGMGRVRLGIGYGRRSGDFFFDQFGGAMILESRRSSEQSVFITRDGKEWRQLEKASEFAKANPFARMMVDASNGRGFGLAQSNGRIALWEVDLDDVVAPTVAVAHPKADIADVMTDGAGRIVGVSYEAEKPNAIYIDERLTAVIRGVEKALPNAFNFVRSMTPDAKKMILVSRSDVEPGRFFLYDSETRKVTPIGSVNSKLDSRELAAMRPIEFAAADGRKVTGYLTAKTDAKNAPFVVLLHDGQSRSRWSYDELTQYLAAHGYTVMAVNFRGSSGFGKDWQDAGRDQWGGAVYSDVVDGVKWAIAQGIADSKRVCMIGRGHTGYTALLGAIRDEALFTCVGSIGGRTDLEDFASAARSFGGATEAAEKDTAPKTPKNEWPVRNADKMNAPVLLIHGARDTRSPVAQSEEMAKALQRANKPHKFVKLERATQYFWRPSERAAILRETEAFLRASLGTATE